VSLFLPRPRSCPAMAVYGRRGWLTRTHGCYRVVRAASDVSSLHQCAHCLPFDRAERRSLMSSPPALLARSTVATIPPALSSMVTRRARSTSSGRLARSPVSARRSAHPTSTKIRP
jgi:hypothetical protein